MGSPAQDTLIWVGSHSPGWSVAVAINEGMLYYYDGELVGTLGAIEEFRDHTHDLEVGWGVGFQVTVESFLTLAGRITGRFLDRDWFTTPRVLYRVSPDAAAR